LAEARDRGFPEIEVLVIGWKALPQTTILFAKHTMENGIPEAKDPSGFLSEIIGAPVTVKLNSGVVYKGECWGRDSHL